MRAPALLALLLVACSAPPSPQAGPTPVRGITLCVANETSAMGRIKATVPTVGTIRVEPGATECKVVAATLASVTLHAETIAGGLRYQTLWSPGGERCWLWRLSNVEASEINLTPCSVTMPMGPGSPPFILPETAFGFAACRNVRSGWVNLETILGRDPAGATTDDWSRALERGGGEELLATLVHEAAHLAQMREDPSCDAHWLRVALTPGLRVQNEAEAYCLGARAWARQNRKPFELAVVRYGGWLANYGFGLTPAQAEARIASAC